MRLFFMLSTIFWLPTAVFGDSASEFEAAIKAGRQPKAPGILTQTAAKDQGINFAPLEAGAFERTYNQQTGYAYTTLFDTRLSRRFQVSQLADGISRFVEQNSDELGLKLDDLDMSRLNTIALNDTVQQTSIPILASGLPLHGAYLEFSFAKLTPETLVLRSVTNQSYGGLPVLGTRVNQLSINALQAITGLENIRVISNAPIVFPKVNGDETELYYASIINFRDDTAAEDYTIILRNGDQSILEAFQHKVYEAPVKAEAYKRGYLDNAKILVPLDRTPMVIDGESLTTDIRGKFEREPRGSATISLSSNVVRVRDAGSTVSLSRVLPADNSGVVTGTGNDLNALNAYTAIHRISKFTRQQIKASETSYLRQPLTLTINVSGSCNAFYDGNISLYRAGGSCANMAIVNDVIMHEWGHGLDSFTGRTQGINDSAYSEGIGDILAAYFSGSSNMGPGFYTNRETGIRELANTKRAPTNLTGEPHNDGLIIGGSFWDLRAALIARYGETKGVYKANYFFLRHLLVSNTYREALAVVLSLDDNDANPATRSPNFCLINAAFAKHGLSTQAACDDVGFESPYPIDASSSMALINSDATLSPVAVSTTLAAAKSAFVCLNGKHNCTGDSRITLDLEGRKEERLFFVSKDPVSLSEHQFLTFGFTDANGTLLGARTMKVVAH